MALRIDSESELIYQYCGLLYVVGYTGVSTDPSLAYRIEMFPGMASLIKKSFYDKYLKEKMETCCMERWRLLCTITQIKMK